MRNPFRRRSIPIPDGGAVRGQWLRHLVPRLVLAVVGLGLLAAAVVVARGMDPERSAFVPRGSQAVVVVDLSKSVEAAGYARVGKVLGTIAEADEPAGLVIFSDTAYELLPPGSPAADMRPILRYFRPTGVVGGQPQFPPNPWSLSFAGGTRVSTALGIARAALEREHMARGSIILISDLEIPVSDVPAVTEMIAGLRREGVQFRVVPLFPTSDARFVFERLVGKRAFVEGKVLGSERVSVSTKLSAPSVRWLLALAGLLVLVVAANERWCGRLEPRGGRA
jgi:hypothetical protein